MIVVIGGGNGDNSKYPCSGALRQKHRQQQCRCESLFRWKAVTLDLNIWCSFGVGPFRLRPSLDVVTG